VATTKTTNALIAILRGRLKKDLEGRDDLISGLEETLQEAETIHVSNAGWSPVWVADNLGVMSVQFMLPSRDDAVIWRGPKKNGLSKSTPTSDSYITAIKHGGLRYQTSMPASKFSILQTVMQFPPPSLTTSYSASFQPLRLFSKGSLFASKSCSNRLRISAVPERHWGQVVSLLKHEIQR